MILLVLCLVGSWAQIPPRPVNPYPNIRADFQLEDGYIPLNHGSYGVVPVPVTARQRALVDQAYLNPDRWFREEYRSILNDTRRRLADLVGAAMDDLVLIENASEGCNVVLRSIQWNAGDKILTLPQTYYMVKNIIAYLGVTRGVISVEVPFTLPVTSIDNYLEPVRAALVSNTIRLCLFSHISSMPGLVEPVAELIELCHAYGADVFLDGAHAVGNIQLNLSALDVEYYSSNAHKWSFSPTASAFLYVKRARQDLVVPAVLSMGHADPFATRFEYKGTKDYTGVISIGAAMDYIENNLGGYAQMMKYNNDLALYAGHYLAQLWQTSLIAPDAFFTGSLVMVALPGVATEAEALALRDSIYSQYGYYFVYSQFPYSGDTRFWTRLSCQVYLDPSDFEHFGDVLMDEVQKMKK